LKFDQIYGHEKPVAILKSAMAANRVAHAYLFYGMEGVGKKTVAAVFARALNCLGDDRPCDACPSCLKAEHDNHPNIIRIIAEGQFIKIDAIREIRAKVAFHPEGGKRVFILHDADKMNAPAANAFLKTLEEPSDDNVLLLTTTRPHALPVTIVSRCQALRFAPLRQTEVARFLRDEKGLGEVEADAVAAASLGSIGGAMNMRKENYLNVRNMILARLANDNPADMIQRIAFARRLGTERDDIVERLQIMQNVYRDSLTLRETQDKELLIYRDHHRALETMAQRLKSKEIISNIKYIAKAMDAISRNANKTLTLEALLVGLH
jgi:DNA polymerase-3 subunit delta'